jgi:hypothetical protein
MTPTQSNRVSLLLSSAYADYCWRRHFRRWERVLKTSRADPRLSSIGIALSLVVAACSPQSNDAPSTSRLPPLSSSAVRGFGISPKAALYVSDAGTNVVSVYGWPKPHALVASLTGFNQPQGECADRSGNVFITNSGGQNVLEYPLGATSPTNTLEDKGWYPVSCSYDTTHGALAVANLPGSDEVSTVVIYEHSTGTPRIVTNDVLQQVYQVHYDASGNLYAYGQNTWHQFALAEMPAGSKKFKTVCPKLLSAIEILGIGWDGDHLVMQTATGVDRIKNCKIVGFTRLLGPTGDYVFGRRLVALSDDEVAVYVYPKGGFPIQTLALTGVSEPIGLAIAEKVTSK